ncbi:MAG: alkaline phosphatase family protein [Thermodesulfobacteriota bacterium]
MTRNTSRPPLVILGVDAGDPDFIQKWAQEGYMPTIASIMKRGCWGRTAGAELISEHGVWMSVFSGISRSQHGYYYFRQLKPGAYELEEVAGPDIDAPPFWSHLRGRDKKVAIIDVPDSDPLSGIPGIQLSNWSVHNSWNPDYFSLKSEPEELLQEVRREFGPKLRPIEKLKSSFEEDHEMYMELLRRVEKKGALCRQLLRRDRFDVVVIVFSESHAADHQFWRYHSGINNEENGLTTAIRNIYGAIDREIGLILAGLPDESNVFIVSSVGMEDDYPTTGLAEAFMRQLGYQAPLESNGISMSPTNLARRVIPESWRIALSRHLPREKRERLVSDQFRSGTDWRKTTAFAIPSAYTSFIRVNLRGREPEGIVEPGAEYNSLLDHIETDLKRLIDPETKKPAVTGISRTIELFDCAPHALLPDLFVEWQPGRFMQRVVHPRAELTQKKPDFFRRSDHSHYGFVGAAGPSIHRQGRLADVEVLNLAPTFLSLMGEPLDKMVGRVMRDILKN